MSLDSELDFRFLPDVGMSKEWVDPFLGGRVRADLSERISFLVRTDFGGFDIGSASDFSWNILTVLGYHISQRTSIWGGYRILDVDYDSGSGANLFEYDVTMSGPIVGLAYRF